MISLKFNKSELVNLSYSLRREVLEANKTGAYCNTSIVDCNTRKYHGLLAVTLDRFGGDRYLLLSQVDESLIVGGKQFNLGIHCYGDIYEPRGHKYVVDFDANPVPQLTYKVGEMLFKKSMILVPDKDQVLIRYELVTSPHPVQLSLKPFLAFRNIHALTHRNNEARTDGIPVRNGMSFRMYANFPDLYLQLSRKDVKFTAAPHWNMNVTYSDEYRRGFDCNEDLFVPGYFDIMLKEGESIVLSASLSEAEPAQLLRKFNALLKKRTGAETFHDQLVNCADKLISRHNNRLRISAGLTWMYTGLLRETLQSLAGLTLYGLNDPKQFEEILDNLIEDEQQRLFHRTTQVESPLYLAITLQKYIKWGADEKYVWGKYGNVLMQVLESYTGGHRQEVTMHPNGLLWAQMEGVALTWMNAYINGRAVTERAGYQVETNAFWYNAICFALAMENEYNPQNRAFIERWSQIRDMVKANYQKTFWNPELGYLADYVDNYGQNMAVRPNQIYAFWVKYSPVDEELAPSVLRVMRNELVTARGLRTLSPRDVNYKGVYDGSQYDRDLAYHQGSTRTFLLEPYIDTRLRIYGDGFISRAKWLMKGFVEDLNKHGVGAVSELYDGDPPHEPHGTISSARGTAALLAVDHLLNEYGEAGL
ncbi:MAG: glycogen debranching enzyme family protein [Bacteroidales bacterium]|nr:glycogen debranching enzyme family protein [Candidatus Egerieousia equi]